MKIPKQNKIFFLLKRAFTICKTQNFLFLRHANTYWHAVSLFQVLFCYPFYIIYPHKLLWIMLGKKSYVLPQKRDKTRTKLGNILYKAFVGAFFGFLFWLPFWWFILASILSPLIYGILCAIFVCFILYCCVVFISVRLIDDKVLCNIPINFNKSYFSNTILPYFIIFAIFCMGIFSLLHNNSYFGVSLCYPLSIAIFLFIPRNYRFWFGFFVGVFGFYWMTLSFRFQDLDIMIPFAIIAVGLIYGIFFWFLCYFQNLAFRFISMLLLFVIHPLDFNWLNIAYLSAYGVFEASLLGMLCVGLACYFIVINSALRLLAPILLLISFDYDMQRQEPKLHAKIIETKYPQDMRWIPDNREHIIENNLREINNAIKEGYPIVVLPETAFPLELNLYTELYSQLLDLSHNITIVAGAIRLKNNDITYPIKQQTQTFILDKLSNINNTTPEESYINTPNMQLGYYNTTYIFSKGHSLIADKNVLVPFGETLPFSDLLSPIFEKFFGYTFGFNRGNGVVNFILNGFHIAIANCYEGTMDLPYKTGSKYILMLSNNAWFSPSTQHFMQQMIVKYYARNYQTFIYHSTNYTKKAIITPNNGKD